MQKFKPTYYNDLDNVYSKIWNLLKLGLSLLKLDRREDACVAFAQLLSEFPNGTQNLIRRASTESKRLGCAT